MSADNGSCPKDSAVILRSNDVGWKSLSGVVGGRERVADGGKGLGGHPTQRLPTNIVRPQNHGRVFRTYVIR